jgi:cell fate (sporulation/competence/biofilm development) regulator YmcA (YheA/YmcA/DUF963 family)
MSTYTDPFLSIHNKLTKLTELVLEIKNAPKEDYSTKYYTRHEAAELCRSSVQSIDNYIKYGWINVEDFGPKKKLIHHYQIFNEDNSLKDFKYKRKAQ